MDEGVSNRSPSNLSPKVVSPLKDSGSNCNLMCMAQTCVTGNVTNSVLRIKYTTMPQNGTAKFKEIHKYKEEGFLDLVYILSVVHDVDNI